MSDIILDIDDDIIKKAQKLALKQNTSLAILIKNLLQNTLEQEQQQKEQKIMQLEKSFDELGRDMGQRNWNRDNLYEQ